MKKEVIFNSNLHFEHELWNNELAFWQDELKSFKNRLSELVMRWTDDKVLSKLEQFQNNFIRQAEVIDTLQESINYHETNIAEHYKIGEDVLDTILVKKHKKIREAMETQRIIYSDLKKGFFRFLSAYM